MSVDIRIDVVEIQDCNDCACGRIFIGVYNELFVMPLSWWGIADYKRQWSNALDRLEHHGQSCLVAAIDNPNQSRYVNWWLLYRCNGKIFVQNQILVGEIYDEVVGKNHFTVETCYDFIPLRYINEDGDETISEWVIDD